MAPVRLGNLTDKIVACRECLRRHVLHGDIEHVVHLTGHRLPSLNQNLTEWRCQVHLESGGVGDTVPKKALGQTIRIPVCRYCEHGSGFCRAVARGAVRCRYPFRAAGQGRRSGLGVRDMTRVHHALSSCFASSRSSAGRSFRIRRPSMDQTSAGAANRTGRTVPTRRQFRPRLMKLKARRIGPVVSEELGIETAKSGLFQFVTGLPRVSYSICERLSRKCRLYRIGEPSQPGGAGRAPWRPHGPRLHTSTDDGGVTVGLSLRKWDGIRSSADIIARRHRRPSARKVLECEAMEPRRLLSAGAALAEGYLSPGTALVAKAQSMMSGAAAQASQKYTADLQRVELSSDVTPAEFKNLAYDTQQLVQDVDMSSAMSGDTSGEPESQAQLTQQYIIIQNTVDLSFLAGGYRQSRLDRATSRFGQRLERRVDVDQSPPGDVYADEKSRPRLTSPWPKVSNWRRTSRISDRARSACR